MKTIKTFVGHACDRSSTAARPRNRGTERGRPAPGACSSYADPVLSLRTGLPNVSC